MLNVSNRLCNPTPFLVTWPYDKGVVLKIEPDGHLDLPVEVMDDFRPDKPGHEAVKVQMDQYGIFLKDPTRAYEDQAMESLTSAVESNESMYKDAYNNMRRRAAASGTYDEEAFAETLEQMGYATLKVKVDTLKSRLAKYRELVTLDERILRQQHDPERTLLFLDPPKEFDSKIAMEIFLSEPDNKELREQQEAWLAAEIAAETAAEEA